MKHSVIAGLLFAVCFQRAAAADVPPPDKLLPADVLGMVTVADYPRTCSNWERWPTSQLWNDPAMKPFRTKIEAKWKSDVLEPLQRELGLELADLDKFAKGQVTLAVTANGWEGKQDQSPGFMLLMDTRDQAGALKERLGKMRQSWTDRGKPVRTETIRNQEFAVYTFAPGQLSKTLEKALPKAEKDEEKREEKPKGKKKEWLIGQSESLFLIADSAKEIEKVLIRRTGGGVPGLSDQPAFAAQYGPMFRDSLSYGWVNIKTILETFTKSASLTKEGQQGPMGLNPARVLSALGLNSLQSLAFNLKDSPEGTFSTVALQAPEASRQGLIRILAFPAKESQPVALIPGDVVKFSRWRVDLQKTWNTLESSLVEMSPQLGGVIKLIMDSAGKDKDPNFDLRKSLIANLGDDVITYEKRPRKVTLEELSTPPKVTLMGSPKPENLASALKVLAGSLLPPQTSKLRERDFLGRKVYAFTLPQTGKEGAKTERTVSFAATGAYVAFSSDVAALEEFLRGTHEKSLGEIPGLAAAAEKVGGMGTGLFGYENARENWRAWFEALRQESGSLANVLKGSQFADKLSVDEKTSSINDWFDFSLLPPFAQVERYFHYSVWSGATTANGLMFRYFMPTPPELRK